MGDKARDIVVNPIGPGMPGKGFSEVCVCGGEGEIDKPKMCFFFLKQNGVGAKGQDFRESLGRNGERVTGNEKEEMQPRREQEMMHRRYARDLVRIQHLLA